jgi:hypothetical protein
LHACLIPYRNSHIGTVFWSDYFWGSYCPFWHQNRGGGGGHMFFHQVQPLIIHLFTGLYGYSCTVQLRTMKQYIWDQQFTNVECPNSNICRSLLLFYCHKIDHEICAIWHLFFFSFFFFAFNEIQISRYTNLCSHSRDM